MAERNMLIPRNYPSTYFRSNMYVTFFSDVLGLRLLDDIGADNVIHGTDYPHNDTTWPDSRLHLSTQTEAAGLNAMQAEKVARGNARRIFGLDRAPSSVGTIELNSP